MSIGSDTPSYRSVGGFGFRTAALPVTMLDNWLCLDVVEGRREASVSWLIALFKQSFLHEALEIASPGLGKRWNAARNDPATHTDANWLATLAKYLSRACCRSTPFGLFAGISAGTVTDRTQLILNDRRHWIRHVRPDYAYLLREVNLALAECRAKPWLPLVVNTTLYRCGDNLRYFVPIGNGKNHSFRHVEVELSAPIAKALECCDHTCTRGELIERLSKAFADVGRDRISDFIDTLLDRGIILSALEPALTSTDAIAEFASAIPDHPAFRPLRRLDRLVRKADRSSIADTESSTVEVLKNIAELDATSEIRFQVDMEVTHEVLSLSRADEKAVEEALAALSTLSSDDTSSFFRERAKLFLDRWGDQLVPLGLVADDDAGLNWGQRSSDCPEIVRRLPLKQANKDRSLQPSAREMWLVRRVIETATSGNSELVLTGADLESFTSTPKPADYPIGISVLLSLYESDNATQPTIWIENVSASATAPLGRFCTASKPTHDLVRRIVEEEQACYPDAVLAEIVHLPRPVLGNVTSRPVLRAYEIPYAGKSGASHDRQLLLEDLFVGVDHSHRFFLWSKQLQRQVVPMLSSAHNFGLENCLGVYRFLCYLSTQGQRGIGPLLSRTASLLPWVPRIKFGRCVLRVASWLIEKTEFEGLKQLFALKENLESWAIQRSIPRMTTYGMGDQLLVLDLKNPILMRCFLEEEHSFPLILSEASPEQRPSLVSDRNGQSYRHQIVLPMVCDSSRVRKTALGHALLSPRDSPRAHLPGGNWLYLKIYAGLQTLDRIVAEHLSSVIARYRSAYDRETPWFFLRYADPESHLRIRFSGPPASLNGEILTALHDRLAPLLACGLVVRMQIDTYVPEIGRYGGQKSLEIVENIFCADSEMHLTAASSALWTDPQARLRFGVESVCRTLDDFGFDDESGLNLLARLSLEMIEEIGVSSKVKKQIGSEYRSLRQVIESPLSADLASLLEARSHRQRLHAGMIREIADRGELQTELESLISSVLHMSLNRLFVNYPRQQEMFVYDFARRHLAGLLGRRKAKPLLDFA